MTTKKNISHPPRARIATGAELGVRVRNLVTIDNFSLEAGTTAVFDRRSRLKNRDIILFYYRGDYRIGMLEKTWPDLWTIHCPGYGLVGISPNELRCLGAYVRTDDFFAVNEIESLIG